MGGPEQGIFEHIGAFRSKAEGIQRSVRVYTPCRAVDQSGLPVVVMQDGQNLFDHPSAAVDPTWGVNTCIESLCRGGLVKPWIIAAVDHRREERISDFTPWPDTRFAGPARGARYADFVVDELLPFLRAEFLISTDPECTAIVGSSLGGLIALYTAAARPGHFARIGALSPTVMWGGPRLEQLWNAPPSGVSRIYLDAGARERFSSGDGKTLDYGGAVPVFAAHLQKLGYPSDKLRLVLEANAPHHESAWRRRLPDALGWLLA